MFFIYCYMTLMPNYFISIKFTLTHIVRSEDFYYEKIKLCEVNYGKNKITCNLK